MCLEEKFLGELLLNYLINITLPNSLGNCLGHVFVPNGEGGLANVPFFCTSFRFLCSRSGFCQGQIPAVWILAAKLPNSDLNFAVDFLVDFFLLFFPRKKAPKNPPKNPPQNPPHNSLGTLFGKIPLGFLQKPFLEFLGSRNTRQNQTTRNHPFANLGWMRGLFSPNGPRGGFQP